MAIRYGLILKIWGSTPSLEEPAAYEPTIELVSDIPVDSVSITSEEPAEQDSPPSEALPDFSAVTKEMVAATPGEAAENESVTVEVDEEELALEVEADSEDEALTVGISERVDLAETDLESLLEVQEPTKILTSEDLRLTDDSLVKEPIGDSQFEELDVIDLEEDSEIREIEMEELEAVESEEEESLGLDLEETVPVENLEMEQLANEDLSQMIDLDYTEEASVELGPDDLEPSAELVLEGPVGDELTLDDVPQEELTTQEFFGEELPTEEFPAEKLPDEKTAPISLESEISFDEADLGAEPDLVPEEISPDTSFQEIALEAAEAEEALFEEEQEEQEEEPSLEVTEDIAFDEITLDEPPVMAAAEEFVPDFETEPIPEPSPRIAVVPPPPEPSVRPQEARFVPEPPEAVQPPPVPPVVERPVAPPVEPIGREERLSAAEMATVVSSILGKRIDEAVPARMEFADSFGAAVKGALPERRDFSENFDKALSEALPSRTDFLDGVAQRIA